MRSDSIFPLGRTRWVDNGDLVVLELDMNKPSLQIGWVYPQKISRNETMKRFMALVNHKLNPEARPYLMNS